VGPNAKGRRRPEAKSGRESNTRIEKFALYAFLKILQKKEGKFTSEDLFQARKTFVSQKKDKGGDGRRVLMRNGGDAHFRQNCRNGREKEDRNWGRLGKTSLSMRKSAARRSRVKKDSCLAPLIRYCVAKNPREKCRGKHHDHGNNAPSATE